MQGDWDGICPNTDNSGGPMARKKKEELEALILRLLKGRQELGLHDVAEAANMSKTDEADRKAIRRAFQALIKRGLLQTKGAARARVYLLKEGKQVRQKEDATPIEGSALKDIPLTAESEVLLEYLAKPTHARTPVGYDQSFLKSYEPNKTFYLDERQRADLLATGKVENTVRPAGTYARNILNRLLIDLSWNSSRLEGNTYSLLETKRLIELGESAPGKDTAEAQMILNHKGAIEYIIEPAENEITSHEVCSIHALLSENLLGDPGASGRLRQISVGISGTTYLPLDNPHVLKECFEIFIKRLNSIKDPFEQSFFSLVHLSYMQAFEDVNKRTARLVANIPLIKQNLKPLSFTDVDKDAYVKSLIGVYEKNDVSLFRDLYLWAYKRSSQRYSAIQQSLGEPNLLKLKYRDAIREIIRTIIIEKVSGSEVVSRIRRLIDALSLPAEDVTPLFQIVETEILSLHEGNVARFRIRPSEFQEWKALQ